MVERWKSGRVEKKDKGKQIYIEELQIDPKLSAFEVYKLFINEPYSFILDSALHTDRLSKYSVIGFNPFLRIESKAGMITVWQSEAERHFNGNPFTVLREYLNMYRIENDTDLPFVGGAVGYYAYDLCHHIEKLPRNAEDDIGVLDMAVGFYEGAIVIDHSQGRAYAVWCDLCSEDLHKTVDKSSGKTPIKVKKRLNYIKDKIEMAKVDELCETSRTQELDARYIKNKVELTQNFTKVNYIKAVERAKEYIRDGDIFQMNMTQRFTTLIDRHPINIYQHLREVNPAPFAAYIDLGEIKILSSSPERFISKRGNVLETRPIKGTIARGVDREQDEKNKQTLYNSSKDRAENVMIVDLMRNDFGRVCRFESVEVTDLFEVETYSTVHHLVSTVKGVIKDGYDAIDVMEAAFPGGSITGAPKIRAMEIIDNLEPTCRGVYTGSIGYIGFDGDMDLNIAIRTIVIRGERAYYQVGGGIVADSVPVDEYAETLSKGEALQRVLQNT